MSQPNLNDPDSLSRIVMLAFGRMEQGGTYWCYVAVKPSRYEAFRKAMASMAYNMQDFEKDGFGEVVVSGEGDRPPSDITKKVAAMFDVSIRDLFKDQHPDETVRKHFETLAKEANQQ